MVNRIFTATGTRHEDWAQKSTEERIALVNAAFGPNSATAAIYRKKWNR